MKVNITNLCYYDVNLFLNTPVSCSCPLFHFLTGFHGQRIAASRFQRPEIREFAAQKVRAHPEFAAALDLVVRGRLCEEGMIYLDAFEVPEPMALTRAVDAAIR